MGFKGFSLVEIGVVVTLISILFAFMWINLLGGKEKASQTSSIDVLVSDIRSEQLKAMTGATEGRVTNDAYGIHFNTTSYVLFHGLNYSSSDPSNRTTQLGDNEQFTSVLFANNNIVFASGSGEIVGFTQGSDSVTLRNLVGKTQKTIYFNKYGSITGIN